MARAQSIIAFVFEMLLWLVLLMVLIGKGIPAPTAGIDFEGASGTWSTMGAAR